MNAITYKEVFPLIKENKMWLGYTRPKEFIEPNGNIKKFGNITWFTNLDIPKRHDDLILWKKYSPEEYPHYDNYDAINVDKVAEIPCDYCESWGLYPEEFETLDKTQWEEVRREPKNDTELIYVIPAKNTELRQALHEHAEGYKEKIESELANVIYCSGCMGVPITVTDKLNPEQFEIINANNIKNNEDIPSKEHGLIKDKEGQITQKVLDRDNLVGHTCKSSQVKSSQVKDCLCSYCHQKDTVKESSEFQLHSSISGVQNNSNYLELQNQKEQDLATDYGAQAQKLHNHSLEPIENTNDCLSKRYCSGCIGVPITVLDKYNPEQLEIVKFRKGNNGKDLTYTEGVSPLEASKQASKQATEDYALLQNSGPQGTVTESSECQLRSLTNGVLNNLELSQCQQCQDGQQTIGQCLTASQNIQESLSQRYCNGIMGVPITIIDKLNPKQFDIIGCSSSWMIAGIKGSMPSASFMELVNKGKVRTGGTPGRSKVCWVDNEGFANVGYHRLFLKKI